MPAVFTVQDDTGEIADANAYIAVAFFDQYHLDRGRTAAAALTNDQKQIGIVRSTMYVDMRWRTQFLGDKQWEFDDEDFIQSTEWPRVDAYYKDSGILIEGLPVELQNAIAEYALRAATAELLIDPTPVIGSDGSYQATGVITEIEQVVGPVKERKVFAENGQAGYGDGTILVDGVLIKQIPAADMYMEALLRRTSRQRKAIR